MRTTVDRVYVEVIDNGKAGLRSYPIRTPEGELMAHRLEQLVAGKFHEQPDIRSVGMYWKEPYQLLQEIVDNRAELQHELYKMEGTSELAMTPILLVPKKAPSCTISELILKELRLRKQIKARLRELDQIKEAKDAKGPIPVPYSW